jgi:hypothetical protein
VIVVHAVFATFEFKRYQNFKQYGEVCTDIADSPLLGKRALADTYICDVPVSLVGRVPEGGGTRLQHLHATSVF